ncbi:MAG: aminoglycoside phosphotransferase family protein [Actinomycetota bacterium]|nr:aminoglycoside phosphotransferase family protein [Candidatus Dormibacteraeota bacterium]MDQ6949873.1 aminoglycoside phosphotransferase family protein [Actinomycetota bacterium]
MPATAERQVLLCTDLHAGNILAAQRKPWLMIDPKPYVGHSHSRPVAAHDQLPGGACGRPRSVWIRRTAELLELQVVRLSRWRFARCVQESIDQPFLSDVDPA